MKEAAISGERFESYFMPPRIIMGRGVIKTVHWKDILKLSGKVLLVTGDHYKQGKDYSELRDDLLKQKYVVLPYGGKIIKSDIDTVNTLTDFLRSNTPEIIIAIGGGTIIDTVKSAAILVTNGGQVQDYFLAQPKIITNNSIPVVAIPTTAGTGSEVTPWSVVWDFMNNKKHSLSSQLMFPYCAIIDSALTDKLPPKITAETGMDAFTQAVEAYWSNSHNSVSDLYALESVKLIMEFLPASVNRPSTVSRDMMSMAALYAGLAFSNTKTTICHSLSYPLTIHWAVTHGQAVSITLPELIRYSFPILKGRRKRILDAIGGSDTNEAARKVEELIKRSGLATRLSELGISKNDLPLIVAEGYDPGRINNSPRIPAPDELICILERIL